MQLFLNEILEKKNITVSQLQKLTGISRSTLTPLSKSSYVPPKTKFETLERISRALSIPLDQLISFDSPSFDILDAKFIPYNKFDDIQHPRELVLLKISSHEQPNIISCLSGIIRYSFPMEFADQAFEYRLQSDIHINQSWKKEHIIKDYTIDDKIDNEKLQLKYKQFINRLIEKYKDNLYVDGVFFNPISNTDIQELINKKEETIINYINPDQLSSFPDNLSSNSYMQIVKEFIDKFLSKRNAVDQSDYLAEEQKIMSEIIFSFQGMTNTGVSQKVRILYNQFTKQLSYDNQESWLETPIKEYLGINPDN